jgi:hypothetical protein
MKWGGRVFGTDLLGETTFDAADLFGEATVTFFTESEGILLSWRLLFLDEKRLGVLTFSSFIPV